MSRPKLDAEQKTAPLNCTVPYETLRTLDGIIANMPGKQSRSKVVTALIERFNMENQNGDVLRTKIKESEERMRSIQEENSAMLALEAERKEQYEARLKQIEEAERARIARESNTMETPGVVEMMSYAVEMSFNKRHLADMAMDAKMWLKDMAENIEKKYPGTKKSELLAKMMEMHESAKNRF